jgi:Ca-activated chloride channel homolog
MQKTLARCLLTLVLATSCKAKKEVSIDLVSAEDTSGHMQIKSNADFSSGFDGADVSGGGTAMALEEGKMGYKYRGRYAGVLGATDGPSSDEAYRKYEANGWTDAAKDRLSTFAADVDTASYTIARRKIMEGELPPAASVRVEEMVNYFHYTYPAPAAGSPFSVTTQLAPSPFDPARRLLRVGVSTKTLSIAERKPANLVFLVDVSGSMDSPDKLDLAKRSLRILVDNLKDSDTVSVVTYAGDTRVVLPPTKLDRKRAIVDAIDGLSSGGGTAMGDGIALAYAQAEKGLRPNTVSRVIVLSDGDANVGRTSHEEILATIQSKVKEGVTLSTIGFGMGNYKDELMEQLADKGNGNNFYIDGVSQAKRVFQEQLGSTLEVVAKDVKLQVDFDATQVKRYRLIGYENRNIADEDFRNDRVDAGEIGAGHQVTALYELELAKTLGTDPLAAVRIRHKTPTGTTATEAEFPLDTADVFTRFADAPDDFQFAFAVAGFADVLRGGADAKGWDLAALRAFAVRTAGQSDERKEFVKLVDRAIELRANRPS